MAVLLRIGLLLVMMIASAAPLQPCHAATPGHAASMPHMAMTHDMKMGGGKAKLPTGAPGCLACVGIVADAAPMTAGWRAPLIERGPVFDPLSPDMRGVMIALNDPPPWADC